MVDVTIRWAEAEDFKKFIGQPTPYSCRAVVAEIGGELVAIAGVTMSKGVQVAFFDMKHGLDVPKMTVWRHALVGAKMLFRGQPVAAVASKAHPNSRKFLEKMGFIEYKECDGDFYYVRYGE